VKRIVTPSRLVIAGLVLLCVVLALAALPSNDYIFLPDNAHPVAPLVTFKGSRDPTRGGVYFVDVVEKKASLLERLFPGLHKGADLYPADAVNPPGLNDTQTRKLDAQDMVRSQEIAAAVALRAAGKPVTITPTGALIDAVQAGKPALGKLEPGDVIVALNGRTVDSPTQVFNVMSGVKVGSTIRVTIHRGKETLVARIRTVKSDTPPFRPVVGVFLEPSIDIHLPFPVRIDVGNVGGPSAGLAFALEVLQELGRNVLHGHKIAATGELAADGSVHPIGGIKQKTIGARDAGVDAFLVPAGDNAVEARKHADGLRIIPVETFPQALRALATLGPAA
jgi:Lon-like protease